MVVKLTLKAIHIILNSFISSIVVKLTQKTFSLNLNSFSILGKTNQDRKEARK